MEEGVELFIQGGFGEGGDAFGDGLGDVVLGRARAGAAGVENGLVGGGAVGDDDGSGHAQERRAAVDLRIHVLLKGLERGDQGDGGELIPDARLDDTLEPAAHRVGRALGGLEDDIADEAIADDDVGLTLKDIVPFDIALEADARGVGAQEGEGVLGELVALAIFGADAHQADGGLFAAED